MFIMAYLVQLQMFYNNNKNNFWILLGYVINMADVIGSIYVMTF